MYEVPNRNLENSIQHLCVDLHKVIKTRMNHATPGLFRGTSGQLLYSILLQHKYPDSGIEGYISERWNRLQCQTSTYASRLELSDGIYGIAWLLEYVNQRQTKGYDPEFCGEIDNLLAKVTSSSHWAGEIEMVTGLAGILVYAARRSLTTNQMPLYCNLIGHYENIATKFGQNQLAWAQPDHSVYRLVRSGSEEFNLGLAHGVVGILAGLLPAYQYTELRDRVHQLLEGGSDWLIQQQRVDTQTCYFASFSGDPEISRLGWCYGDLPIALTLARVGQLIGNQDYLVLAKQVALRATERNVEDAFVWDAGLCHGSAGLGLMFQMLHKQLALPELKVASDKWYEYTVRLYEEKGLKGLWKFDGRTKQYEECTGFLEGYAGIGLCLLAWQTGNTDWTDCLLLS